MVVTDVDIILRLDTLLSILRQGAKCTFDVHGYRGFWQIDILGGRYYSQDCLRANVMCIVLEVFEGIMDSITILIEQKPCKWFSVAIRIKSLT